MAEESTPPPWPPLAADASTSPVRGGEAPAGVEFPVALRGYDRDAVDAYVRGVSQQLADLRANRSEDDAVRRALERVGEEVSGILSQAHQTAEQLTVDSRRRAEERLESAEHEASAKLEMAEREASEMTAAASRRSAEMTASAERRLKELDAETDRIWAERHQIVEDARALAGQLLALADSASARFPEAEDDFSDAGVAEPVAELREAQEGELSEPQAGADEPAGGPGIDETAIMPPLGEEFS